VAVDFERRLQRGDQPSRHQLDLRFRCRAGQDGDEFVAADAGQRVAVAQGLAQAGGRSAQHGVADGVAQPVIDLFEAVQPYAGDGKALARAARIGDHHADAVRQQQPVGQFGQGIVGGHVAQPLFGCALLLHIPAYHQQLFQALLIGIARQAQLERGFTLRT
jgi:hypothetical protein